MKSGVLEAPPSIPCREICGGFFFQTTAVFNIHLTLLCYNGLSLKGWSKDSLTLCRKYEAMALIRNERQLAIMKKTMCVFVIGFALVFSFVNHIKTNYSVEEPIEETSYEELQLSMSDSNRLMPIISIVMDL